MPQTIKFSQRECYFWSAYLAGSTVAEAATVLEITAERGRQIMEKTARKIQKYRQRSGEPALTRRELREIGWQIPPEP